MHLLKKRKRKEKGSDDVYVKYMQLLLMIYFLFIPFLRVSEFPCYIMIFPYFKKPWPIMIFTCKFEAFGNTKSEELLSYYFLHKVIINSYVRQTLMFYTWWIFYFFAIQKKITLRSLIAIVERIWKKKRQES